MVTRGWNTGIAKKVGEWEKFIFGEKVSKCSKCLKGCKMW